MKRIVSAVIVLAALVLVFGSRGQANDLPYQIYLPEVSSDRPTPTMTPAQIIVPTRTPTSTPTPTQTPAVIVVPTFTPTP